MNPPGTHTQAQDAKDAQEGPAAATPSAPPALDMDRVVVDPRCALALPAALAIRRQMLPFAEEAGRVYVATRDAADRAGLAAVERHLGRPALAEAAEPESLRRAIERVYGDASRAPARLGTLDARAASIDMDGEAAIALVEELLRAALLQRASDIHLDPTPDALRIRLRVDGKMERYRTLPREVHPAVVGRLKVLGGLDIAERRAPQDGRFRHVEGTGARARELDVRVATLPTRHGERVTMRLLLADPATATLDRLGFEADTRAAFDAALARPFGLILLTGPTGSGKTTTLYAGLRQLIATRELNVLTVEDPIEIELPGIAQCEVTRGDKVSFHRALRHLVRHDPDVLMIGEIRDADSADVAIKSALTGHLVLSTLHANTAIGAVTRLADLGVERYLVAATLRLSVAQRLVRRLCRRCATARPLTAAEAAALDRPDLTGASVDDATGCRYCAQRGYVGRHGLFELLRVDEGWAERIVRGDAEPDLVARFREQGLADLRASAADAVTRGITSPAEALAAIVAF